MLHDAFLRIFARIETFRWQGEGSLKMWLEQVTRNTIIDTLRQSRALTIVPMADTDSEPTDEPTADDIYSLNMNELMQLISELPAGYRAVINLYCIDGLPHKEIARLLGIKEKSSASQLNRAKAMLAKKVKKRVKNEE